MRTKIHESNCSGIWQPGERRTLEPLWAVEDSQDGKTLYPIGFRVYRNCIGFGSGVLGGFAGFWGVLPGFAFAFVFWAPGCGLVLPGFAFAFVFWAPGVLPGFTFAFVFWAGFWHLGDG